MNRIQYLVYEQKQSDQITQQKLLRCQQADIGSMGNTGEIVWINLYLHTIAVRAVIKGEETRNWVFMDEPYEDVTDAPWAAKAKPLPESEAVALELQYRARGGRNDPPKRFKYI